MPLHHFFVPLRLGGGPAGIGWGRFAAGCARFPNEVLRWRTPVCSGLPPIFRRAPCIQVWPDYKGGKWLDSVSRQHVAEAIMRPAASSISKAGDSCRRLEGATLQTLMWPLRVEDSFVWAPAWQPWACGWLSHLSDCLVVCRLEREGDPLGMAWSVGLEFWMVAFTYTHRQLVSHRPYFQNSHLHAAPQTIPSLSPPRFGHFVPIGVGTKKCANIISRLFWRTWNKSFHGFFKLTETYFENENNKELRNYFPFGEKYFKNSISRSEKKMLRGFFI